MYTVSIANLPAKIVLPAFNVTLLFLEFDRAGVLDVY
jgi:hypothetical protein